MYSKLMCKIGRWVRARAGMPAVPTATTMEGWDQWHKDSSAASPFLYWLLDNGYHSFRRTILYPFTLFINVVHHIRNRFITKSHLMKTGLKPGQWHEFETRLIHGMFNELVEFVEVELANMQRICGEYQYIPKYQRYFPWIITTFMLNRSAEAGMAYLDWEASLVHDESYCSADSPNFGKPTSQAIAAIEIKDLYYWWTAIRPNRKDLYMDDASKLDFHTINAEEEFREEKDEEMMNRLIKVRRAMWT